MTRLLPCVLMGKRRPIPHAYIECHIEQGPILADADVGISHTPREYSNPDACAKGTDVLANAVLRLADQP